MQKSRILRIAMRHGDLMNDPFYAGILFAIESKIHEGDRLAASDPCSSKRSMLPTANCPDPSRLLPVQRINSWRNSLIKSSKEKILSW